MTDVGRLGDLIDRAQGTMIHKRLPRVSPLAVPVLVLIGREHVAQGTVDDALLIEAEALAADAMARGLRAHTSGLAIPRQRCKLDAGGEVPWQRLRQDGSA